MKQSKNQLLTLASLDENLGCSNQILSLGFKPLLIHQLLKVTSDYLQVSGGLSGLTVGAAPPGVRPKVLTLETMPLHRTKEIEKIIYRSAIAFKLQKCQQKLQQKSPIEIAQEIAAKIDLSLNFSIDVIPPGWIQFHLTQSELARWLQRLIDLKIYSSGFPLLKGDGRGIQSTPQTEKFAKTQNQPELYSGYSANDLFLIQYVHGRCCSLLQLGAREGLITLSQSNDSSERSDPRIITPNPIPWLNAKNQLRLTTISESALISQLVTTLDTLSGCSIATSRTQILKLAICLSQDFITFYSQNRIWSQIKTKNLPLAQARLGLIQATQIILKLLLEEGLGIFAPPTI